MKRTKTILLLLVFVMLGALTITAMTSAIFHNGPDHLFVATGNYKQYIIGINIGL